MRKILISILCLFCLAVSLSSNKIVYAEGVDPIIVEGDIVYQFGTYEHIRTTNGTITTSVDQDTQLWKITGSNTGSYYQLTAINGTSNLHIPNQLGYALDSSKTYLISYQYVSGELTSGDTGIISGFSPNLSNQIMIHPNNYTQDIHYTINPSSSTANTFQIYNNAVTAVDWVFRIIIKEISPDLFHQNDINLFSQDNQTTIGSVTYQLYDGNTVKINGSTGTALNVLEVDAYLSDLDDDEYYILKYNYISGTLTGGNTGSVAFHFSIGNASDMVVLDGISYESVFNKTRFVNNKDSYQHDQLMIIKGSWLKDVAYKPSIFARRTASGTVSSLTYNEFVYELNVQKLSDFLLIMNPPDQIEHTISLEFNGGLFLNGSSGITSFIVLDGESANNPGTPHRSGFIFAGWYKDAPLTEAMNWDEPITEDLTLFAKWTPSGSGAGIDIPSEESDSTILIILLIVFGVGAFYLFTKKRRES